MTRHVVLQVDFWPALTLIGVLIAWLALSAVFWLRKKPQAPESRRDPASMWGIALQGVGYGLIWMTSRRPFTPIVSMARPLKIALALATLGLVAASVWLALSAVRALGRQWAIVARVVEGHKLVTDGPYRWVRNPIYTSMLGMLVATGLAAGRWQGLLGALLLFAIGTAIRVRSEERLLRQTFGAEFEAYARRVPAVLPRLFP